MHLPYVANPLVHLCVPLFGPVHFGDVIHALSRSDMHFDTHHLATIQNAFRSSQSRICNLYGDSIRPLHTSFAYAASTYQPRDSSPADQSPKSQLGAVPLDSSLPGACQHPPRQLLCSASKDFAESGKARRPPAHGNTRSVSALSHLGLKPALQTATSFSGLHLHNSRMPQGYRPEADQQNGFAANACAGLAHAIAEASPSILLCKTPSILAVLSPFLLASAPPLGFSRLPKGGPPSPALAPAIESQLVPPRLPPPHYLCARRCRLSTKRPSRTLLHPSFGLSALRHRFGPTADRRPPFGFHLSPLAFAVSPFCRLALLGFCISAPAPWQTRPSATPAWREAFWREAFWRGPSGGGCHMAASPGLHAFRQRAPRVLSHPALQRPFAPASAAVHTTIGTVITTESPLSLFEGALI